MADVLATVEAARYRSEQVRALLDNPILIAVFEALRADAMQEWQNTTPEDVGTREDAWQSIRALDRIQRRLEADANDGAVMEHNMRAKLRAARMDRPR